MLPCKASQAFVLNKPQIHSLMLECNTTELENKTPDFDDQDRHLFAQDCKEGEGSIQKYCR